MTAATRLPLSTITALVTAVALVSCAGSPLPIPEVDTACDPDAPYSTRIRTERTGYACPEGDVSCKRTQRSLAHALDVVDHGPLMDSDKAYRLFLYESNVALMVEVHHTGGIHVVTLKVGSSTRHCGGLWTWKCERNGSEQEWRDVRAAARQAALWNPGTSAMLERPVSTGQSALLVEAVDGERAVVYRKEDDVAQLGLLRDQFLALATCGEVSFPDLVAKIRER